MRKMISTALVLATFMLIGLVNVPTTQILLRLTLKNSIKKLEEAIMRFVYVILFSAMIVMYSVGCAAPAVNTPTVNTSTETSANQSAASSPAESNIQEELIIKASYEKPLSLNNKNTILLDGLLDGEEYIEVIVNGEIFNFEQIELIWNESKSVIEEKETVKTIEKLANQTLVIKTTQPEGIPTEKIKWKSRTGKAYEYIIQESSLDDSDNSRTKFEIN